MPTTLNAAAKEFDDLRSALGRLGQAVLNQAAALEQAAPKRDKPALKAIVARDHEIDALELNLDRMARSFMELRAPLGPDFRFVLAALDIARNLERIGDCIEYVARHISEADDLPGTFPAGWSRVLATRASPARCRRPTTPSTSCRARCATWRSARSGAAASTPRSACAPC
jgi:phosphate uptake regulator